MFLKSIRFKIVFWYMLVLTITLLFFSIIIYRNFRTRLYDGLDDLLQSRAEGVADSIDTYWETERLEAVKGGISTSVFSKVNNINFLKIAQRWVKERLDDPELMDIAVQIFDSKGNNIAYSKNLPGITNLSNETRSYISKGSYHFDNLDIEYPAGKRLSLRIFTLPIIEDTKTVYIVQVASHLTPLYSTLNRLKTALFLLLPLTVVLTGFLGAFLAKITLRPFNRMVASIHKIEAENLKLRIETPGANDEIKKLADTFNDMLARLDKAFSSQRQFIQDLSHEFKTPLTILRGELEVALKKTRSPKEYESILCSNLEEINRISKIVDDLLTLARLDSREIQLDSAPLDINLLIEGVLDDMEILAAQKGIKTHFSGQKGILVQADAQQLKRVIVNLLDNSIKYTPSGGSIDLKTAGEAGFIKIEISDTGIGIPQNEIAFIFNRFYRLDKSRSSAGFGLGLSIAKSIVEAHKGIIKVESQLNQGTAFTILLPYEPV